MEREEEKSPEIEEVTVTKNERVTRKGRTFIPVVTTVSALVDEGIKFPITGYRDTPGLTTIPEDPVVAETEVKVMEEVQTLRVYEEMSEIISTLRRSTGRGGERTTK